MPLRLGLNENIRTKNSDMELQQAIKNLAVVVLTDDGKKPGTVMDTNAHVNAIKVLVRHSEKRLKGEWFDAKLISPDVAAPENSQITTGGIVKPTPPAPRAQSESNQTPPTMAQAETARDEAMEQVEEHAGEDWNTYCDNLIDKVAAKLGTFTSDDVMERMECKPHDPRALGPAMKRAVERKSIRSTQVFRPSKRRHCTPVRVWQKY